MSQNKTRTNKPDIKRNLLCTSSLIDGSNTQRAHLAVFGQGQVMQEKWTVNPNRCDISMLTFHLYITERALQ
jgi:hypothetical protein